MSLDFCTLLIIPEGESLGVHGKKRGNKRSVSIFGNFTYSITMTGVWKQSERLRPWLMLGMWVETQPHANSFLIARSEDTRKALHPAFAWIKRKIEPWTQMFSLPMLPDVSIRWHMGMLAHTVAKGMTPRDCHLHALVLRSRIHEPQEERGGRVQAVGRRGPRLLFARFPLIPTRSEQACSPDCSCPNQRQHCREQGWLRKAIKN